MKRIIITEGEKIRIKSLYGLMTEQGGISGIGAGDLQNLRTQTTDKKKETPVEKIYNELKSEIDSQGTSDENIISSLNKITPSQYPFLLSMVMKREGKETIMDWIMTDYTTVDERNAENGKPDLWSQGGLGATLSWWLNDEAVTNISNILSKFSDINPKEGDYRSSVGGTVSLYGDALKDVANDEELKRVGISFLHTVLPISAFVAGFVFPPTWGALTAAGLLELADAGVYYLADNDPYTAGLNALFAFIPFAQLKFIPAVYKLGKTGISRLLKKLTNKEGGYLADEILALKAIEKNYKELEKLCKINMVKKLTLLTIGKLRTAKDFLKWSTNLIKKGLLNPESLGMTGLLVGGSFYTWDKIAASIGICNPSPLSALSQTDSSILKMIGYAGKYLEPNSSPCDIQKAEELLKSYDNTKIITEILQKDIDEGTVYTETYANVYSESVFLIQEVLKSGGFIKNTPKPSWSFSNKKVSVTGGNLIKSVSVYNVMGGLKKEYINKGYQSNFNFDISGLPEGTYVIVFKMINGENNQSKIIYSNNVYMQNLPGNMGVVGKDVKDGFYDKATMAGVVEYQKKNKLSVDGYAGTETIRRILSDYKNHKYGLTKEELNTWDYTKDRVDEINKEFKKWKEEVQNMSSTVKSDWSLIEEAYKTQSDNKKKLEESISQGFIDAENMTEEDANEIFSGLSGQ